MTLVDAIRCRHLVALPPICLCTTTPHVNVGNGVEQWLESKNLQTQEHTGSVAPMLEDTWRSMSASSHKLTFSRVVSKTLGK